MFAQKQTRMYSDMKTKKFSYPEYIDIQQAISTVLRRGTLKPKALSAQQKLTLGD